MNLEIHGKLIEFKERVLKGEDIPAAEYSKIISELREDRMAGAAAGGTTKKVTTQEEADKALDDLFA